jgi:hypothetical protein
MDTGDTVTTGDFDLNLDSVNLRLPKGAAGSAPLPPPPDEDDDLLDLKSIS